MPTVEEKREALVHKTFMLMFRVLAIFGIPAAIAFFAGRYMDGTYNNGDDKFIFIFLGIAFVTSWILVIRMYRAITKEFAALRKEEEAEQAARQQNIQDKLAQ